MLEHFQAVEEQLIATSKIPANAGHKLHRGTPRESFIKEFLTGHLSERLAIGTGEIIDANSKARESRNQFDVVVYKSDYPKLSLGGGVSAFLAESVVATIEIKSLLTSEDLDTAVLSSNRAKLLKRNLTTSFTSGYLPPGIISCVVAYDGPASISTVSGWLKGIEKRHAFNQKPMPGTLQARTSIMSESVDAIFLLGKGSIFYDNLPMSFFSDEIRKLCPEARWQVAATPNTNVLGLFLLLTQAASNTTGQWANLSSYLTNYQVQASFE